METHVCIIKSFYIFQKTLNIEQDIKELEKFSKILCKLKFEPKTLNMHNIKGHVESRVNLFNQ